MASQLTVWHTGWAHANSSSLLWWGLNAYLLPASAGTLQPVSVSACFAHLTSSHPLSVWWQCTHTSHTWGHSNDLSLSYFTNTLERNDLTSEKRKVNKVNLYYWKSQGRETIFVQQNIFTLTFVALSVLWKAFFKKQ